MYTNLKQILNLDLARAESIILAGETGKKKVHGPTIDNFKGQALAYKRVLALLAIQEVTPRGPLEINNSYTFTIPWKSLAILSTGGIIIAWAAGFLF